MFTECSYANLLSNYYAKFPFGKQWMYNVGNSTKQKPQNISGNYLFSPV